MPKPEAWKQAAKRWKKAFASACHDRDKVILSLQTCEQDVKSAHHHMQLCLERHVRKIGKRV